MALEEQTSVLFLWSCRMFFLPTSTPSLPRCMDDDVVHRGGPTSIFDFKVKDAEGGEVDLSTYKDTKKAFLIVNVASK